MINRLYTIVALAAVSLTLCACRVETQTESVPEAEGSGKKAINIRVEPMSRDEMKEAANTAIDKTADAAYVARDVATTAVKNAERIGRNITTLTDTIIDINTPAEQRATTTNPE